MKTSVTRRDALRTAVLLVPALVASRAGAAGVERGLGADDRDASSRAARGKKAPSVLAFAAGTPVALCSIVRVGAIEKGGITVRMRDAKGADFLVDVLRYDAKSPGIARAGSLAVYLANGGKGSKATHEDHGIAAMALASMIERREAAGMSVPALSTQTEREPLLLSQTV